MPRLHMLIVDCCIRYTHVFLKQCVSNFLIHVARIKNSRSQIVIEGIIAYENPTDSSTIEALKPKCYYLKLYHHETNRPQTLCVCVLDG